MSRYQVVSPWTVIRAHQTDEGVVFAVEAADIKDTRGGCIYIDGAQRVRKDGKPVKLGKGGSVPFIGETAWSDAQRLYQDWIFQSRYS